MFLVRRETAMSVGPGMMAGTVSSAAAVASSSSAVAGFVNMMMHQGMNQIQIQAEVSPKRKVVNNVLVLGTMETSSVIHFN